MMAACHGPRWHIAACELQQELLIISNYYPLSLSLDGFDLQNALPRSVRSVFLREVADPAVTQYLMVI